ncbi:MAG: arsenite methyltransferase [Deltaproteobacteria bacterium]|nr:arsenite methyltransferase [Deltaproteobacteria bacterium]
MPEDADGVRDAVRDAYGKVALGVAPSCCGPSDCCGSSATVEYSEKLGYQAVQLEGAPAEANLGLGCGNPTALATLKAGEVVVDLGAGAGLDAFIAAKAVGPTGRVIGVDMTTEMLARARANAVKADVAGYVEFREGIIEALPVVADSVDVIISNCVINLSPDKAQVFREAFRVLKPGGRLAVSDIVLSAPLPEDVKQLADAYVGCVGGALLADDYLAAIKQAGFVDVKWESKSAGPILAGVLDNPTAAGVIESVGAERLAAIADTVLSYNIEARKP